MKMVAETMHSFGVFHALSAAPGRNAIMKNSKRKPQFTSLGDQKSSLAKQSKSAQTDGKKNGRPTNELT